MSVLHINQIKNKVNELFRAKLDLSDINDNDIQKEDKINTRCLAAYAIYLSVECTVEDAANAVVDGGDDNGIDAIYYSQTNKKVVIAQSKFSKDGSGEPDSAGVAKFCTGVRDLFNLTFNRFNSKINVKKHEIELALNEFDTKYSLVFIDTHVAANLAEHSTRHINDILSEMNNVGDENAEKILSFERLNQSRVHASLALSAGNDPIDIELGLTNWGLISEPYKAYYGMVSAKEIYDWWSNYNTRLFEKNIRQVLGNTEVNDEIRKTLLETPELFWYFNNGITLIVDRIEKSAVGGGSRDIGSFKLTKIAIVNGAQTVSSIGKFGETESSDKLDNVKVSIRIIQILDTPENFDKEVTRTNNRQNRIENRDFVSQDPEQIRIRTELLIEEIDYNIMRSETFRSGEKSFELTEATVALASASGRTALAVQAKSGIGKFFENLDRGIYKEIFNGSVSGYYVYNTVRTVRKIDEIINTKTRSLGQRSGRDYGILIHGNRIIALIVIRKLNLKLLFSNSDYEINEIDLQTSIDNTLQEITAKLNLSYPDSILGTLFKNGTKCTDIVNSIIP